MAGIAQPVGTQGLPVALPAVLLSGGETTLTNGRDGAGKGGRNTEFLLSFAVANEAQAGICALAGDSDGIDGTEDTAGAIVTPDTLTRGRAAGLDVPRYLTAHHNFSYFDALGDLVRTGPTLTHVDDIRAILIS